MTISVLQSHESWARMVIAISGSSGLIGSALVRALESHGHEIRPIVRRAPRTPLEISWNPEQGTIDAARLNGADAVIHLAGENIAQRWTHDVKRRIRDSRVHGTTLIAQTLASLDPMPRVLVSGSAIGIYGDRGDETLDESSAPGTGFLADVCREWETATAAAASAGIRVVTVRTGLVLSHSGGALAKLLPLFRLGLGGKLGTGQQWMSWIALADYVEAIGLFLRNDQLAGPFNLVAPNPVTNAEFTRVLGRVLGRPEFMSVPRFALQLAMGEMAG
ncbi:MAG: TIGR01777 family oxidoreductase, partial [Gemmatimonadaceae bacterium]